MAGTALGMLVMPQLVKILLEAYEFQGAILLLSGIALNSLVGAMLLQPVKWHMKDEEVDIELEMKEMDTIKETEEEDALPEINTLLYHNNRNMKKNFSDVNFGSHQVKNGNLPKRPTFPRLVSTGSTTSSEVRKRKESVISSLSYLDFSVSNFALHVDVSINNF